MVRYFDDIEFLDGSIIPACRVVQKNYVAATYSLEFIRSGRMAFGVGVGESRVLDRPALFWHRPKGLYNYGACDEHGWHHHWITCRGERARRLIEWGLDSLSPTSYLFVTDPVGVSRIFEQMIRLFHERTALAHARAVSLMEEMLAMLLEHCAMPEGDEACRRQMEALCHMIQIQPANDFDFEAEATRLHMSYSHFRRRFRQFVGRAPHDYLLIARMHKAVRDLMQPAKSVKLVAIEAGYDDATQFSRMFKRVMGLSPSHFRQGMPGYNTGKTPAY